MWFVLKIFLKLTWSAGARAWQTSCLLVFFCYLRAAPFFMTAASVHSICIPQNSHSFIKSKSFMVSRPHFLLLEEKV
jgi:hypothetical protein